jgi:molybdopterin-containing oxidoreductase family membrane subunit
MQERLDDREGRGGALGATGGLSAARAGGARTVRQFALACGGNLVRGSGAYYRWIALLALFVALGAWAYVHQLQNGLVVTAMTDQVSWGAYIANFTFLVGMAAAAVMLVIPAYVYHDESLKEVVVYGELLAIAAITMCLLFVVVDLGRADRFWHMLPVVGRFHWPESILSWDVIVLNIYLVLNVFITVYLLYSRFSGRAPNVRVYIPVVFLAIAWAFSIHTVTAFLYSGLVARPYWNAAILAPRFLASAFSAGPCFMIVALQVIHKTMQVHVRPEALRTLRSIVTVSACINLFLLGAEVFTEFYAASVHAASAYYLFFGLHGQGKLVPYIWSAVGMETLGVVIFAVPRLSRDPRLLNLACCLTFVGVWVEKGMGLIIPGFVPSPLGEVVEYSPSFVEFAVSAGIWAGGILVYTLLVKMAVPILRGTCRARGAEAA